MLRITQHNTIIYVYINMIRSFRHRGLKRFWIKSDASKINPQWIRTIEFILSVLDGATSINDVAFLNGFHKLTADRKGELTVTVTGNWRITFKFQDGDIIEVDLSDYH